MNRSRFLLTALVLALVLPAFALNAQRRRPARITGVTLSGTVLDAADSSAVFGAVIRVQDKTFLADERGQFVATGLTPGAATVTFERWGYQPLTQNVTLQEGGNTLDARLTPKAAIELSTVSGGMYRADYETAYFATQGPLSPYVPLSPAEFCRGDGTIVQYEKGQLSRITSNGTVVEGGACCPSGGEAVQVVVTPKEGTPFTAYIQECRFYRYDLVARDRATGNWLYLSFRQITDIRFP